VRIGLLSGDYSVDSVAGSGGGIDTYVRQLAGGLSGAGHEVHIVAPTARVTRSFEAHGATVHALRIPSDMGPADSAVAPQSAGVIGFAWHSWRKLRDIARTAGPFDVVEAAEYKAPGFFAVRDRALPTVVKCHAHLPLCLEFDRIAWTGDLALIAALEQETLRRARAVNSNSRALADRCARDYGLGADRIAIVPYGIDTSLFRPVAGDIRTRYGLGTRRVVLFVGRMEERKGISSLVEAFALVAHTLPDVVLMIAGPDVIAPPANGSNAAWMCSRWDSLGVPANRYLFLGMVPHAALPAYYSAATISVAPSPFEAFGLVYLESMACGCPPIGCRTGGAPEVIRDGRTGVLVPPDDPARLAEAMTGLLQDPCRRVAMSDAGRGVVSREFSVAAMVDRTVAYYREALSCGS
jgi:glycosyltransferase involved in cell wall biosynthesis